MKKTINGKEYDTDKAEAIATYRRALRTDPTGFEEMLYRTKCGNWFSTERGETNIRPLTEEEHRQWLEDRRTGGGLLLYFVERLNPIFRYSGRTSGIGR